MKDSPNFDSIKAQGEQLLGQVKDSPQYESVKLQGGQLLEQVKQLIHEGNVRRVIVKQDERTIAEFPLTLGLVGVALAPVLAAVGAIAALLTNCTIEIERRTESAAPDATGTDGDAASESAESAASATVEDAYGANTRLEPAASDDASKGDAGDGTPV